MQDLETELKTKHEQYLYHLEMTLKLSSELKALLATLPRDAPPQPGTGHTMGNAVF